MGHKKQQEFKLKAYCQWVYNTMFQTLIPTGTIYNSTTGIGDFGNETILNGTTITLTLAAIAQVENIVLKNISEITAVDQEDVDSIPNNRN